MSNSKEQSLDENVIFLEVTESSPEFLYSERERQVVERLLSAGPETFYSSNGTERSGCFLSPEEVRQIGSWAQDYHCNQVQWEDDGGEGLSQMEDFCSTYFPCNSDTPAPDLDLGWPEKGPWLTMGNITVHTSPPSEGEPPVREIIRQHLQRATRVIAIVTDSLTDGAIIGDLHKAASRAVPVYIILNQRSIQEDFTLNRLHHPNIRVRVLGGKAFCSRTGRTVVGEMKDKFLLVDLETVIHGSYSLTWTDAHLHRQLITVLHGPVVDSFDLEFRTLFAASLSVANTSRVAGSHSEDSSSLSDIMKRIQPQQSTSWLLKKGSNTAVSELSQSMKDLSVHTQDTGQDGKGVPVPRFKASCLESDLMTPAFTLMKKRNDDLKSALYRTPTNLLPRERPRSFGYGLNMDWRRSLAERELGDQE
ncbi:protein FAM83E [Limanda limanda]|uniref:protein FAM83E n=1 Tax=Limanda limanda TaxID=27771 RepID=UPI0029C8A55F|nr:protein FAM83E [Limanda limanda]